MLGKLSWKNETDSSLNLTRGDSWLLVITGQVGGLVGNLVKDVVDERIHDRHSLGGDTSIWMDLFEDLVDVNLVGLSLQ